MKSVRVLICSRWALASLFGLAAVFALGTAAEAQSAAVATVAGRVVNATPDAPGGNGAVAGAAVTLHMQTLETQDSVRTITDAQGRFRF